MAGVEYDVLPGGEVTVSCVVLKNRKGQVEIEKQEAHLKTISALAKFLPKDIPVFLALNGKGIIHKKIPQPGPGGSAIGHVLPNAEETDFYMQQIPAGEKYCFVSVARRQAVDELLKEFMLGGIQVVSCSFGPFQVSSLSPLLNLNESVSNDVRIGRHKLKIMSGRVEEYAAGEAQADEINISFGDMQVRSPLLVALSAAISHFSGSTVCADIPSLRHEMEEYFQKNSFRSLSKALVACLLFLLLLNYFLFEHYSKKHNELILNSTINESALNKYELLQKEVKAKKQFLDSMGMLETSRVSYYADQLCFDLPAAIRLDQLNINPQIKSSQDENAFTFLQKKITVSGNCRKSSELNAWIKKIKNKTWIRAVNLVHFSQDKISDAGVFTIEISVT